MKIAAILNWKSALVSALLVSTVRADVADSEVPSTHVRRRVASNVSSSGWTRAPENLRSGNSTEGEPSYRVWVQFKPNATHSAALSSVQSTLVSSLGAPTEVAAKMMVPEKDSTADAGAKSAGKAYAFTMHYDFYDSDVQSMVMTMSGRALKAMKKDPNVLRVEMDQKRFPFDAVLDESNHEENNRMLQQQITQQGELIPTGVVMTKANQVWAKGYKGKGIKVCVIDSGLDGTHDEFPSSWLGFNTNVGTWYYDSTGHGTHVTGTIAARRNGFGVVGVAPEATVLTYRVLDTTGAWAYSSTLAQAALNCYREGAKVINMSLGGPEYSSAENDMFRSLYSKGVVSVAASGNDGGTSLMYPASYLEVVSVAAVDSKKKLASFSQRNSRVDLSAHGVAVASTLPWWMGDYGYLDGTSMACPHVAGVAALLFSKRPSASAATIVNAMTATAQDLGPSGRDSSYGSGLVNALAALSRV